MKSKYLYIFLVLFVMVISISCTFATDNGTNIGATNSEHSNDDTSDFSSITLDGISQANVDENITITGKVTDKKGNVLSDSDVSLFLTKKGYGESEYEIIASDIIKTDNEGVYKYSYSSEIGGQLNITVKSNDITKENHTSIFIAPKSTIVTMNNVSDCNVEDNIQITGRLTDNDGKALKYTGVGVLVSGVGYGDFMSWSNLNDNYINYVKEYTRTNENGEYTYVYTPKIGGSLDICVYYPGYHYYRFNRTDSHIWVMPKATKVTINPVDNSTKNEVEISGTLTDVDENPLRYTSVGIYDGRKKIYVKTDSLGNYNYTYKPLSGKNSITVYYPGYHYYRFNETKTEFIIVGRQSNLIVSPIIDTYVGDTIKIKGKVTDELGNPIIGQSAGEGETGGIVREESYYSKFNDYILVFLPKEYFIYEEDHFIAVPLEKDGTFRAYVEYEMYEPVEGEIRIFVNYTGNSEHDSDFQTLNFSYVTLHHKKGEIILNPIRNVTYGETTVISGKLIDENNMPLPKEKIIIMIDGGRTYVKTNESGEFSYPIYFTDHSHIMGKHNVSLTYVYDIDKNNVTLNGNSTISSEYKIEKRDNLFDVPFVDVFNKYSHFGPKTFLFNIMWVSKIWYQGQSEVVQAFIIDGLGEYGYQTFLCTNEERPVGTSYDTMDYSNQTATYMLFARADYNKNLKIKVEIVIRNHSRYYYEYKGKYPDYHNELGYGVYVAKITVKEGKFVSIKHLIPVTEEEFY